MKNLLPYTSSKTKFSCQMATEFCLQKIKDLEHINAFINVYEKEAIEVASKLDSKKNINKDSKLEGLIVGLKDMFCYKDHPLTSSSKILQGFTSQITATCVQHLIDNGSIVIGHQNCDQFGMGSSTENSYYGPTKNPIDISKVSGGSSGGSAAAVKAQMCHISLGTDTGGSVRQPAAFCGIVGFKPTYSRISRYGVIAYASSFDTVGILAQNVSDCSIVFDTIAQNDPLDNTSQKSQIKTDTEQKNKYKIAVLTETMDHPGLQKDIKISVNNLLSKLKSQGHIIEKINFPLLDYILPTYYILSTAEASSNLARYDGVRFGYRNSKAENIDNIYKLSRTQGFGEEVKRRILLGSAILSSGYQDKYYTKAQKVRSLITKKLHDIVSNFDYILLPTTPTTAFDLNSNKDILSMYSSDLYTVIASVAGYPAISIPYGEDSKGLPIGIQLIGSPNNDETLLNFADYIQNKCQS